MAKGKGMLGAATSPLYIDKVARSLAQALASLVPAVVAIGGLFPQQGVDGIGLPGALHVPGEVGVDVAIVGQGVP